MTRRHHRKAAKEIHEKKCEVKSCFEGHEKCIGIGVMLLSVVFLEGLSLGYIIGNINKNRRTDV